MHKYFLFFSYILFFSINAWSQNKTVGLLYSDFEQQEDAYTLFAPNGSTTTYLIDNCGHLVHSWESNYLPGLSFYLLENGDLIRAAVLDDNYGFTTGGRGGRIERFNWSGDLIWEYEYASNEYIMHHDFKVLPNGNIIFIAWERKTNVEAINAGFSPFVAFTGSVWPLHIVEVEPQDEGADIVWKWHLWDHLIQDYSSNSDNYGVIDQNPRRFNANTFGYGFLGGADIMHANALDYNEALDQIVFSSRNANEIYIIDHSTTTEEAAGNTGGDQGFGGDFLWRWGNPENYNENGNNTQTLFRQHDVHWIKPGLNDAGKIMVFNNGLGRPGGDISSVDIIEPLTDMNDHYIFDNADNQFGPDSYNWTYSIASNLLSSYESNGQRLPNGNTFICLGVLGHFLELNSDNEIIWEYISPVGFTGILAQGNTLQGGGLPNSTENLMFRAYNYNYDYPGLIDKTLNSQGPIELAPLQEDIDCNYTAPVMLFDQEPVVPEITIHPNPASHYIQIRSGKTEPFYVYDIHGNQVLKAETDQKQYINDLPNGKYLIKIRAAAAISFIKI